MIKLGNITIESETATMQDAFNAWVNSKLGELSGPDGEMPDSDYIKEYLWTEFRKLRYELMRETDHMFLSDYPRTPSDKLKLYRNKLRDIPQQHNDVRDIAFPDVVSG